MSDDTKTESVYERARKALFAACHRGRLLLSIPLRLDDPVVLISAALDAGEAAEKRAEAAEAQIAAMHEAVKEAEKRPPDEWDVFVVKAPDGTLHAATTSQASGFYRAIRRQWESGWVGRISNEFRNTRARAEKAEDERDEARARAGRLEDALKAVSTDIAQDALEDPIGHDERKRAGWYRLFEGTMSAVRSALDPPKEG
jgi:hypothetical protein